jgi:hypothetical protein
MHQKKHWLQLSVSIFLVTTLLLGFSASVGERDPDFLSNLAFGVGPSPSGMAMWTPNGTTIYSHINTGFPEIVSDGDGGAILAWIDNRNYNSNIYVQRINPDGTTLWANGIIGCPGLDGTVEPQLVSDGAGGIILTFTHGEGGANSLRAQRFSSKGSVLWGDEGVLLAYQDDVVQHNLQLVTDMAGGAIIFGGSTGEYITGANYWLIRIDDDGNSIWGSGILFSSEYEYLGATQLVSDGAGGAIIVFEVYKSSGESDIYAQRFDNNGILLWGDSGIIICNEPYYQKNPQIASDGVGGAIITWEDNRTGDDYDIYAQRINDKGNCVWKPSGVVISAEKYDQDMPQIVNDGDVGAIITWVDKRNGDDYNIYAQRVNYAGEWLWGSKGVTICTAICDQESPQLISIGAQGVIITWSDYRNKSGTSDVYAQRINFEGICRWRTDGIAVCTEGNDQIGLQLVSDMDGGAIIMWVDFRGEFYTPDLYAQRIANHPPLANHPFAIATTIEGNETIGWVLRDDQAPGLYRVRTNDISGNFYIWSSLKPWTNNSDLAVPINRSADGIFNYTIEYFDDQGAWGTPDTVVVFIMVTDTETDTGTNTETDSKTDSGGKISGFPIFVFLVAAGFTVFYYTRRILRFNFH